MKHQLYREQQLYCDIETAWGFFLISDEFIENNTQRYGVYGVVRF